MPTKRGQSSLNKSTQLGQQEPGDLRLHRLHREIERDPLPESFLASQDPKSSSDRRESSIEEEDHTSNSKQ